MIVRSESFTETATPHSAAISTESHQTVLGLAGWREAAFVL